MDVQLFRQTLDLGPPVNGGDEVDRVGSDKVNNEPDPTEVGVEPNRTYDFIRPGRAGQPIGLFPIIVLFRPLLEESFLFSQTDCCDVWDS